MSFGRRHIRLQSLTCLEVVRQPTFLLLSRLLCRLSHTNLTQRYLKLLLTKRQCALVVDVEKPCKELCKISSSFRYGPDPGLHFISEKLCSSPGAQELKAERKVCRKINP
uniref:Uncharacterized protein n=1 Tax=Rhipicephalus appendiculatus TaxID=34631 RepID=A0A131YA86_RHIAP